MSTNYLNSVSKQLDKYTDGYLWKAAALIGGLVLTSKIIKTLSFASDYLSYLIPWRKDLTQIYGEKSWVVITGASDGIGRCFCFNFAKRGFNVILVARNEEKLNTVARELVAAYPDVQTRIVVADFSEAVSEAFFEKLMWKLEALNVDISILVNNVGAVIRGVFHSYKLLDIQNLLVLNCLPQLMLTHHFIHRFQKRLKRTAIISMASCTGQIPASVSPLYAPSKQFNDFLSNSLVEKYGANIDFLSVLPNLVSTGMCFYKENFLSVSPDACSEGAINHLSRKKKTFATAKHFIIGKIYRLDDYFARLYYRVAFGMKIQKIKVDPEVSKAL